MSPRAKNFAPLGIFLFLLLLAVIRKSQSVQDAVLLVLMFAGAWWIGWWMTGLAEDDKKGKGKSSKKQKPLPKKPIEGHPLLEEGNIRKSIKIMVASEAWAVIDQLMKNYPGISPVIYGYLFGAGVVRFRQTVRITGSTIQTFITLLEDFSACEHRSSVYPLLPPPGTKGEKIVKAIEVSLPESVWFILDNVLEVWRQDEELSSSVPPEEVGGYFLTFGLWWFKELLLQYNEPITAMKHLLQEVMDSGEIGYNSTRTR
jgi:hypothetical protein